MARAEIQQLMKEPCFIEAHNVSESVMKLIKLEVDRSKGMFTDEEDIDIELDNLTANELRLKRCILRQISKMEEV